MDAGARAKQEQLLRRAVYSRTAYWPVPNRQLLMHSRVKLLRVLMKLELLAHSGGCDPA